VNVCVLCKIVISLNGFKRRRLSESQTEVYTVVLCGQTFPCYARNITIERLVLINPFISYLRSVRETYSSVPQYLWLTVSGFRTIELIQVELFWVVMRCSIVVGYQCFGGPCCLHLQGEVTILSELLRISAL